MKRFLGRPGSDKATPDEGALPEQFEVTAYAAEVVVRGRIEIPSARLSDLLATSQALSLKEALATVLIDGREIEVGEIDVLRDDLLAISMAGPRGDPKRRTRRGDEALLAIRSGPYRILGLVHLPPMADPVLYAQHHGSFLPLTEAVIGYEVNGVTVENELDGLIVSRDLIDRIGDERSAAEIFGNLRPSQPEQAEGEPQEP